MILCGISAELKFIIIKIIYIVIVQSLSSTCDLFSRIVGVFNEMEMKINVINNKIFPELYLKVRVRRK